MYAVISFSHKKLDISLREQIALPHDEIPNFYKGIFQSLSLIQECIILSTCNRFEILLYGDGLNEQNLNNLIVYLAQRRGIKSEILKESANIFSDRDAVEHILKVASSLDSLVIGETQITGQLKSAYKTSFDLGFCKKALSRLVHFAFKCSALVRNQTQISKSPVSVASVAVAKFMQYNPNKEEKVIVVGTGEIGNLCAKHLLSHGFNIILLSGRIQSAQALAQELGEKVEVAPLSSLHSLLALHPYLFTATGAPHAIITKEIVPPKKQCLWFDMALPRDIEDGIIGAEVFVIDDLQEIVNDNINKRQQELSSALEIIHEQTKEFFVWIKTLEVEPIIKSFRAKAEECAIYEIKRAVKKGFLARENAEEVERILHNAFNKFLHHPTVYIKTIKEHPEGDFILDNVKKLFDLGGVEVYQNPYKCEGYFKNKKD